MVYDSSFVQQCEHAMTSLRAIEYMQVYAGR